MPRSSAESIVGPDRIATSATDRLIYSVDGYWLPQMWLDRGGRRPQAAAIVYPQSAAEVARILAAANDARVPVVPWGGGSGTQGGALPAEGGLVIDLKRLNRILEINERSLYVTAEAGVNGTQLEWALNERGLTLPHYPASANCATLGGYLAPRGSGTISTKYGKAEDLVMSIEVVLPDGRLDPHARVPNHASGPDFMRLFLGSEGTFGVITEATMRVTRLPETRLFRAMLFGDVATGLEAGPPDDGRPARSARDPDVRPALDRVARQARARLRALRRLHDHRLRRVARDRRGAGGARARDLRASSARVISGREPGERWWNHRYDFYYPPLTLHLPAMYGTVETVATFDQIEAIYHAKKAAIEGAVRPPRRRSTSAHFSHWFPVGCEPLRSLSARRGARRSGRGAKPFTIDCGTSPSQPRSRTAA